MNKMKPIFCYYLLSDLNYCGEFPVPKDEGIYKAEVEVLLISKEGKEQQVLFTGKNDVKVIKPDYITLIQTDKPIYKPGQTVKFRAMVMDYLLTPELVNVRNYEVFLLPLKTKHGFIGIR